MIYMCNTCKKEAHPDACVSGEAVFMSAMFGHTKVTTIRGLIEELMTIEDEKGETALVAFTLYTEDDIVEDCEDFDVPSVTEAWEAIVQDVHDDINNEFVVGKIADEIRQNLRDKFPEKN